MKQSRLGVWLSRCRGFHYGALVATQLLAAGLAACSPSGERLPQLGIDMDQTSASGLSAGAYMAGQLQVVHSTNIIGTALVAGGPYGCAETGSGGFMPAVAKNVTQALEGCMSDKLRASGIPDVPALNATVHRLASEGKIDPVEGLASDKVKMPFPPLAEGAAAAQVSANQVR